jgi:hypothetical protein
MGKDTTAVDQWERVAEQLGEWYAKQVAAVVKLVGDRPAWATRKTQEQLFEDYQRLEQGGPDAWAHWISDRMQVDGLDPESAVNEALAYDVKMRQYAAKRAADSNGE